MSTNSKTPFRIVEFIYLFLFFHLCIILFYLFIFIYLFIFVAYFKWSTNRNVVTIGSNGEPYKTAQ